MRSTKSKERSPATLQPFFDDRNNKIILRQQPVCGPNTSKLYSSGYH